MSDVYDPIKLSPSGNTSITLRLSRMATILMATIPISLDRLKMWVIQQNDQPPIRECISLVFAGNEAVLLVD
jgi:hypothetical protein